MNDDELASEFSQKIEGQENEEFYDSWVVKTVRSLKR
jgi:hypothetical protein